MLSLRTEFSDHLKKVTQVLMDWRCVAEPIIDHRRGKQQTHRIMSSSPMKPPLTKITNAVKISNFSIHNVQSLFDCYNGGIENEFRSYIQEVFENKRQYQLKVGNDTETKLLWRDPTEDDFRKSDKQDLKSSDTDQIKQTGNGTMVTKSAVKANSIDQRDVSTTPNPVPSPTRMMTRRMKKLRRRAKVFSTKTMIEAKEILSSKFYRQHLDPVATTINENNWKRPGELTTYLANKILPFSVDFEYNEDEGIGTENDGSDSEYEDKSTAVENQNKLNDREASCISRQAKEIGNVISHESSTDTNMNDVAETVKTKKSWLEWKRLKNLWNN